MSKPLRQGSRSVFFFTTQENLLKRLENPNGAFYGEQHFD